MEYHGLVVVYGSEVRQINFSAVRELWQTPTFDIYVNH
jgi:hypothetical protein